MTLPRLIREQFKLYERAGFTVKSITRASRHYRVNFNQFPEVQYLTPNATDLRSYKNNIALFKRLGRAQQEKQK
jgi:hypothetical protein